MGADWYEGCWRDRKWRLNHLYWIEVKSGPPQRFRMNWAQEELFDNLWTRNQVLKARQLGISTLTSLYILDAMLFEGNFHAGIIDKRLDDAVNKLGKMRFAFRAMVEPPGNGVDWVEDAEDRGMIADFAGKIARLMGGDEACDDKKGPFREKSARFLNGSDVQVGTSMRGGTLKFLHVSEFGWKAAHRPQEAREVITGGVNTVSADSIVVMESTHEGGKAGENYRRVALAMRNVGKRLDKLEERFFFFPWWKEPSYRLPVVGEKLYEAHELEYFAKLAEEGILLDEEQKRWYVGQWRSNGMAVRQEYPSTPAEALDSQIEGAIYGREIDAARMDGRLDRVFEADDDLPLYVSWDLGVADWTSLWLFQPRRDGKFSVLDCKSANRQRLEFYVGVVRRWEAQFGQPIKCHFLPHDGRADKSALGLGTAEFHFRQQGLPVVCLKRTGSVFGSIQQVRRFLRHCVFHERCGVPLLVEGEEFMSGLNALENYRWAPMGANGEQRQEPLHSDESHPADAFRYFVEAYEAGLVTMFGVRVLDTPRSGVLGMRRVARGASWRR